MKYEQIAELLNGISERFDWEKVMEGDKIIGLKQVFLFFFYSSNMDDILCYLYVLLPLIIVIGMLIFINPSLCDLCILIFPFNNQLS